MTQSEEGKQRVGREICAGFDFSLVEPWCPSDCPQLGCKKLIAFTPEESDALVAAAEERAWDAARKWAPMKKQNDFWYQEPVYETINDWRAARGKK